MFRISDITGKCILACGLALGLLGLVAGAQAASLQVLYRFQGGSDGADPNVGLVVDKAGNLYGTTYIGGAVGGGKNPCDKLDIGCGTVFELASGSEKVLFAFCPKGCHSGRAPQSGPIVDKSGNVYGTASSGGLLSHACPAGCGVVFKVAQNGIETVLHNFTGGSDGDNPVAGLVADELGNLYGTTNNGGRTGCLGPGCGTVFKVTPNGTETVLYTFSGGIDGANPSAGLILDGAGNLYGTASSGGGTACMSCFC